MTFPVTVEEKKKSIPNNIFACFVLVIEIGSLRFYYIALSCASARRKHWKKEIFNIIAATQG